MIFLIATRLADTIGQPLKNGHRTHWSAKLEAGVSTSLITVAIRTSAYEPMDIFQVKEKTLKYGRTRSHYGLCPKGRAL